MSKSLELDRWIRGLSLIPRMIVFADTGRREMEVLSNKNENEL